MLTSPRTSARTLAVLTGRVALHTQPDIGEPARLPFFCCDFLHHLDLEVTFGQQLLQPLHIDWITQNEVAVTEYETSILPNAKTRRLIWFTV